MHLHANINTHLRTFQHDLMPRDPMVRRLDFTEEKSFSGSLLKDLMPAVNPPKAGGTAVADRSDVLS